MNSFIFDVDGTLVDSEKLFYDSLMYALDAHCVSSQACFEGLFGLTVDETLARLNLAGNIAIATTWENRFRELSENAPFYCGIQETFEYLYMRNAHIVLVTSRSHSTADPIWKTSTLAPYIEFCVAAEDTDKQKPHPDPLIFAMSTLNLEPESTIYIGDTGDDYTAAQKTGIAFAAAAWNKNASSLPGLYLASPRDLLALL